MSAHQDTSRDEEPARRVVATPLTAFATRRTRWLWEGRWPLGEISLVAGRGDLGKSTIVLDRAAQITLGNLPGEFYGRPRDVLLCATEDDIGATIKPRLLAVGADLTRVHAIEVRVGDEEGWLYLPHDLVAVAALAREKSAALVVLDPLISRLPSSLDTHRDADVRRALEPLRRMARDGDAAVVGLIHTSKGVASDPATAVMGSAAFVNVARSVSICVIDPDDEQHRLFGTVKNNLGRGDLPTLRYHLEGASVDTDDGDVASVGRIVWDGDADTTVREAMSAPTGGETHTKTRAAVAWLVRYLTDSGGEAERDQVMKAAEADGFSESTMKRARKDAGVDAENLATVPRRTLWSLPSRSSQSSRASRASQSTEYEA